MFKDMNQEEKPISDGSTPVMVGSPMPVLEHVRNVGYVPPGFVPARDNPKLQQQAGFVAGVSPPHRTDNLFEQGELKAETDIETLKVKAPWFLRWVNFSVNYGHPLTSITSMMAVIAVAIGGPVTLLAYIAAGAALASSGPQVVLVAFHRMLGTEWIKKHPTIYRWVRWAEAMLSWWDVAATLCASAYIAYAYYSTRKKKRLRNWSKRKKHVEQAEDEDGGVQYVFDGDDFFAVDSETITKTDFTKESLGDEVAIAAALGLGSWKEIALWAGGALHILRLQDFVTRKLDSKENLVEALQDIPMEMKPNIFTETVPEYLKRMKTHIVENGVLYVGFFLILGIIAYLIYRDQEKIKGRFEAANYARAKASHALVRVVFQDDSHEYHLMCGTCIKYGSKQAVLTCAHSDMITKVGENKVKIGLCIKGEQSRLSPAILLMHNVNEDWCLFVKPTAILNTKSLPISKPSDLGIKIGDRVWHEKFATNDLKDPDRIFSDIVVARINDTEVRCLNTTQPGDCGSPYVFKGTCFAYHTAGGAKDTDPQVGNCITKDLLRFMETMKGPNVGAGVTPKTGKPEGVTLYINSADGMLPISAGVYMPTEIAPQDEFEKKEASDNKNFKSKPCKFFFDPEKKCFKGDKCAFSHVNAGKNTGKVADSKNLKKLANKAEPEKVEQAARVLAEVKEAKDYPIDPILRKYGFDGLDDLDRQHHSGKVSDKAYHMYMHNAYAEQEDERLRKRDNRKMDKRDKAAYDDDVASNVTSPGHQACQVEAIYKGDSTTFAQHLKKKDQVQFEEDDKHENSGIEPVPHPTIALDGVVPVNEIQAPTPETVRLNLQN